jgi:hypothetical protein
VEVVDGMVSPQATIKTLELKGTTNLFPGAFMWTSLNAGSMRAQKFWSCGVQSEEVSWINQVLLRELPVTELCERKGDCLRYQKMAQFASWSSFLDIGAQG